MATITLQEYFAHGFAIGRLRQVDVMAYILGRKHFLPGLNGALHKYLTKAMLVGLDAEWYERDPTAVTELGLATVPSPLSRFSTSKRPLQDDLCDMEVFHARIMENAHMVNWKLCKGYPEDFQFGQTTFVTMNEGRQMLLESFRWGHVGEPLRPIIFIGHAVDNDTEAMKERMRVDLAALGVIAVTLDTQVMAQELSIADVDRKISLKDILAEFAIEEKYLHNAGNDVAQTMVTAWLLACEYVSSGTYRGNCENQGDVDSLKQVIGSQSRPRYGIPIFCTRCDSTTHMFGQCSVAVWCIKCAGHHRWSKAAHTHQTAKCGVFGGQLSGTIVIPCLPCSQSTEPRRWKNATTHVERDCYFRRSSSPFSSNGNYGCFPS